MKPMFVNYHDLHSQVEMYYLVIMLK